MSKPIRKKISFAIVDMEEIEKIKEEKNNLRNNSDVIQFLLYYYLKNKASESDKDEIISKIDEKSIRLENLIKKHVHQHSNDIVTENKIIEEQTKQIKLYEKIISALLERNIL